MWACALRDRWKCISWLHPAKPLLSGWRLNVMIKKADFIWHIGFQGNTAVVNRRQKTAVRNLSPDSLLQNSYYRAAFCSALWETEIENKAGSLDSFQVAFKQITGLATTVDDLKRMMGVYQIPTENLYILQVWVVWEIDAGFVVIDPFNSVSLIESYCLTGDVFHGLWLLDASRLSIDVGVQSCYLPKNLFTIRKSILL